MNSVIVRGKDTSTRPRLCTFSALGSWGWGRAGREVVALEEACPAYEVAASAQPAVCRCRCRWRWRCHYCYCCCCWCYCWWCSWLWRSVRSAKRTTTAYRSATCHSALARWQQLQQKKKKWRLEAIACK